MGSLQLNWGKELELVDDQPSLFGTDFRSSFSEQRIHWKSYKISFLNLDKSCWPDSRKKEEHGHVPGVHADDEPETGEVPAGNLLRDDPDIVGKVRSVDQGNVVQQDPPGQHNPKVFDYYSIYLDVIWLLVIFIFTWSRQCLASWNFLVYDHY